jgi:carbonic anhydrase/acetyltransferase-like protein (isoleucine patch superfamily)
VSEDTRTIGTQTLYRIKALRAFGNVEEGELGGYISSESNLSHEGLCWVYGDAQVHGNARVYGDALVCGNARVHGDALVCGNAQVCGNARVHGDALVCGNAQVYGNAWVYGDAQVHGNARVYGDAWVYGNARVSGDANIENNQTIMWFSKVGSEKGTLTAFQGQHKNILVTRGCFFGTLEDFEKAVKEKHGSSKCGQEYSLLIEVIRLRFS